jgi:hypothetical protein
LGGGLHHLLAQLIGNYLRLGKTTRVVLRAADAQKLATSLHRKRPQLRTTSADHFTPVRGIEGFFARASFKSSISK